MSNVFEEMLKFKAKGESSVLVTVVNKQGDGPVELGKKMVVGQSGNAFGTVGGGALEYNAREKCKVLFETRESGLEKYLLNEGKVIEDTKTLPMVCGGVVTLFYEYIGVKGNILIFGAGHVGQALTKILKTMNYHVKVIEDRPEVYEKMTGADIKIHKDYIKYLEEDEIPKDTFVVVCTANDDYLVVDKMFTLGIRPKYYGMMCSPRKLTEFIDQTYDRYGKDFDLGNFYAPIGINIGGGSPEEIAISITAEILAITYDKEGNKHMRQNIKNAKHRYFEKK
ncbi:MAG: XdhC/CoxI family protein [Candidatus Izemoplasma sp.]